MPTPFLITIDTEGDDLWGNDSVMSTHNARYLDRFQSLCERFNFRPTYLTNYEMAMDATFQRFARDVLARKCAEIGMHLHAWHSPPLYPKLDHLEGKKAYLIEYPVEVMSAKISFMTKLLEETFATKMRSHRAGRWAFDERYAALLIEQGYQVDCSVTPSIDWRTTEGGKQGGSDYRLFPDRPYFVDLEKLSQPGSSALLEVPMSIRAKYPIWLQSLKRGVDHLRGRVHTPSMQWLRPKKGNLAAMKRLCARIFSQEGGYLEFMLHSSELMPDGSPTFRDQAAIDALYIDLEQLFAYLVPHCQGMTLVEFYDYFCALARNKP